MKSHQLWRQLRENPWATMLKRIDKNANDKWHLHHIAFNSVRTCCKLGFAMQQSAGGQTS
jgi:hypothetical protein